MPGFVFVTTSSIIFVLMSCPTPCWLLPPPLTTPVAMFKSVNVPAPPSIFVNVSLPSVPVPFISTSKIEPSSNVCVTVTAISFSGDVPPTLSPVIIISLPVI